MNTDRPNVRAVTEPSIPNQVSNLESVSFFIPAFGSGGVERTAINLAAELVHNGVRVDLITFHADRAMLAEFSDAVNIVDLGSKRTLFSLPKLVRYLRRNNPKILISAQAHANIIAVLAAKLSRSQTKIVLTERLALKSAWIHSGRLKDRILPLLIRIFYRKADLVIANSKGTAEQLVEISGITRSDIEVVPNPAIPNNINQLGAEPVDHPWFLNPEVPVVLSVGRLTAQKDLPTLLKAFALVRGKMDCRLVVVGSGPVADELELLGEDLGISQNMWIAGFDANPYRYMTKSSVFVLTSLYEGLGNVLVEALALALPVVSTDCPRGPSEVLLDGKAGILTAMSSPDETADAIKTILSNPEMAQSFNAIARKHIVQYSVANCAQQYAKLLR